jgi:hypothetical protein
MDTLAGIATLMLIAAVAMLPIAFMLSALRYLRDIRDRR